MGMEKGQTRREIACVTSVIKMDLHDCIQSKSGMTGEMEKELVKKLLSFFFNVQMAFSTMLSQLNILSQLVGAFCLFNVI